MSTNPESSLCEGMYSKLIDSSHFDEEDVGSPTVHHSVSVPVVRALPRQSGPGVYRTATVCLATLCTALLFAIIALSAHYKNLSRAAAASDLQNQPDSQVQMQQQPADVAALTAALSRLQAENAELNSSVLALTKLQDENNEHYWELSHEVGKLRRENTFLDVEVNDLQEKLNDCANAGTTAAPTEAGITTAVPNAPCSPRWLEFNGSCYFISSHSRTWSLSQHYCKQHGAHLAIIHAAHEQTFLWEQLPRGHWNAYWFGISDETTETDWQWVDGTTLVGGFWEEGEPNNHIDEDCGYIVKTRKRERTAVKSWYDAPCSMSWPFICEKEIVTQ